MEPDPIVREVEGLKDALSSERKQKRKLAEENKLMSKRLKFLVLAEEYAFCDSITLFAKDGKSMVCSRFLLAQRSPVLKVKLLLAEDISTIFSSVGVEVLRVFLLYLVTGNVTTQSLEEMVVALLDLAMDYEVNELRDVCLEYLLQHYPRLRSFVEDYEAAREVALGIHDLWSRHKDVPKLRAIARAVKESFIGFRLLLTLGKDDEALESKVDTMRASVGDILKENETADSRGVKCGTVGQFVWNLEEFGET